MLTSPSREQYLDPSRIARAAVLNGIPIPAKAAAQLEARGVNISELEARIRQTMEFRR
jgi:hypothetical protein